MTRIDKAIRFCVDKHITLPRLADLEDASAGDGSYPCCAATYDFVRRINRRFKALFTRDELILIATSAEKITEGKWGKL